MAQRKGQGGEVAKSRNFERSRRPLLNHGKRFGVGFYFKFPSQYLSFGRVYPASLCMLFLEPSPQDWA